MADRSLTDIIRFLDPSGDMGDADIAGLTKKLKFTDVLDLVSSVSGNNMTKAREILAKYDDRFGAGGEAPAQEAAVVQPPAKIGGGVSKPPGGFKPIKPIGTAPTTAGTPTNPNGPNAGNDSDEDSGQELDTLMSDPATKNKPEVQQIARLLQRMNKQ